MKNGYFIGNIPNIFRQTHMKLSIHRGTPKWMIYPWFMMEKPWTIQLTWMIWRYPYFRKPPYESQMNLGISWEMLGIADI